MRTKHSGKLAAAKLESKVDYEERVLLAVQAYKAANPDIDSTIQATSRCTPPRRADGFRKIADRFNVDFNTLRNRYNGMPSLATFNRGKSYLADHESLILIDYLIVQSRRGFPLTHRLIEEKANAILKAKFGDDFKGVGVNWVENWVRRWDDHISVHWSTSLEKIRASSLNPENVKHWFSLVKETIELEEITQERIYAMDETGLMMGVGRRTKVIGEAGRRVQHNQRGGGRELTSVLPPICADGTCLRPTVIFKGKNMLRCWGERNPLGCS